MLKFYPDIQENDPRRFGSGSYCNGEVKKKGLSPSGQVHRRRKQRRLKEVQQLLTGNSPCRRSGTVIGRKSRNLGIKLRLDLIQLVQESRRVLGLKMTKVVNSPLALHLNLVSDSKAQPDAVLKVFLNLGPRDVVLGLDKVVSTFSRALVAIGTITGFVNVLHVLGTKPARRRGPTAVLEELVTPDFESLDVCLG